MKPQPLIAGLMLGWAGLARSGIACTPCPEELDFDRSARMADLIIVGQRTDYSPREAQGNRQDGPDTITVSITEILKGQASQDRITVNSRDGMCPYGIVVDDQPHVMLLQRRGELYDAVNHGCAVKALPLTQGHVDVEGQLMPVERVRVLVTSAESPPTTE